MVSTLVLLPLLGLTSAQLHPAVPGTIPGLGSIQAQQAWILQQQQYVADSLAHVAGRKKRSLAVPGTIPGVGDINAQYDWILKQQAYQNFVAQWPATAGRKKRSEAAVPYIHQEIPAEPYVHTEIPAEPYVHMEPALTPEVLGNTVNTYAGPALAWAGSCVNSLGQGVPCRTQFRKKRSEEAVPYLHQEIPAEPYVHVEIPAEPYVHIEPALTPEVLGNTINTFASPAVAWTGACVNSLGQGVPCRTQFRRKRSEEAVPYVHQEIPAEPYIHTEIPAEPYVHIEPVFTAEVLGNTVNTYAGPVIAWAGACVNSLGQGVPCRTQF